jgi:hypothetical protein
MLWLMIVIGLLLAPVQQVDFTGLANCADPRTTAFCITTTDPVGGMVAVGTPVMVPILRGASQMQQSAVVSGYVIWRQPIRPPAYVISWDGGLTWVMLPRDQFTA